MVHIRGTQWRSTSDVRHWINWKERADWRFRVGPTSLLFATRWAVYGVLCWARLRQRL